MHQHVPAGWPQVRCTVAGFAALVRANTTAITTEGGGGQRRKQVDGVDRESCGNDLLSHATICIQTYPLKCISSRHNPFKPFRSLVTRNIANNRAAHYFSELPVVARVASHIMAGLLESLGKTMGTFCDRHSQKLCIAIDIHNNCALQWLQIAKSQTCLCRRVVLLGATFHMEAHSTHEIVQSVHPVSRQVAPVNYRLHAPVAF